MRKNLNIIWDHKVINLWEKKVFLYQGTASFHFHQRYPCIYPLRCSSWCTKAVTSPISVCCFLLNRSNSLQYLFEVRMFMIIWWLWAKTTSISLLLNLIAKYNLIRKSTADIIHSMQRRLRCDEFDPTLQSEAMWQQQKKP